MTGRSAQARAARFFWPADAQRLESGHHAGECELKYRVVPVDISRGGLLAGDCSSAAMACPWVVPHERFEQLLAPYLRVPVWFETLGTRPAIEQAIARGNKLRTPGEVDKAARKNLFGQTVGGVAELASCD